MLRRERDLLLICVLVLLYGANRIFGIYETYVIFDYIIYGILLYSIWYMIFCYRHRYVMTWDRLNDMCISKNNDLGCRLCYRYNSARGIIEVCLCNYIIYPTWYEMDNFIGMFGKHVGINHIDKLRNEYGNLKFLYDLYRDRIGKGIYDNVYSGTTYSRLYKREELRYDDYKILSFIVISFIYIITVLISIYNFD